MIVKKFTSKRNLENLHSPNGYYIRVDRWHKILKVCFKKYGDDYTVGMINKYNKHSDEYIKTFLRRYNFEVDDHEA